MRFVIPSLFTFVFLLPASAALADDVTPPQSSTARIASLDEAAKNNRCRALATYAEQLACYRMRLDLAKTKKELQDISGETTVGELDYTVPQPIGLYGSGLTARVEFSYQGGRFTARAGDILPTGWKVDRISHASVEIVRDGKKLYLGFSDGATSEKTPLLPPPAYPGLGLQGTR